MSEQRLMLPFFNRRQSLRLLGGGGLALLGAGGAVAQPRRAVLTVAAAASLGPALQAMARAFEATHPGVQVRLHLAGSGTLVQQVLHGAPIDVLMTADVRSMEQARSGGALTPQGWQTLAQNRLVLVVPAKATHLPLSLSDLLSPEIRRIAVAHPDSVPVGHYARTVLQQQGLWKPLQPKIVGSLHVRQSLDYAVRGEVDAAVVYRTDVLEEGRVRMALQVPTLEPIRYPVAVLARARQPQWARAWVEHALGAPGQSVLARYGFDSP